MSEIQGDMLFRKTPVYDNEGTYLAFKNELVITKEEFLTCFNEWVIKPTVNKCDNCDLMFVEQMKIRSTMGYSDTTTHMRGKEE